MDEDELTTKAAKVFFKNAIQCSTDRVFTSLAQLMGFKSGDVHFDVSIQIDLKIEELAQACAEAFDNLKEDN